MAEGVGSQQQGLTPHSFLPLQPYEVLWALAEHHLQKAAKQEHLGGTGPDNAISEPVEPHLEACVRALEAVLLSGVLPLKVEVRTRHRLAEVLHLHFFNFQEAEAHLSKAALLVQKSNDVDMYEYGYRIKDLQCRICEADPTGMAGRTVKNQLKQYAADAARLHMRKWYYHFTMRRARILALEKDYKGCCSTLLSAAEDARLHGEGTMQCALLLSLAAILLNPESLQLGLDVVKLLETLFEPMNGQQPAAVEGGQPIGPTTVSIASSQNQHLRLYYIATTILYNLQMGNSKDAIPKLAALHALAEAPSHETQAETAAGIIQVLVRNGEHTVPFALSVLPRYKLHIVIFLISALTHKTQDGFKAQKHLIEGLKAIEKELAQRPARSARPAEAGNSDTERAWLCDAKLTFLRHISEIAIYRGEYFDSYRVIGKILEWCTSESALWTRFRPVVLHNWAMLYQAVGRYDLAVERYREAASIGNGEFRFLGAVHVAILACTESPPDHAKIAGAIADLEAAVKDQGGVRTVSERALTGLIEGLHLLISGNIRDTKVKILDNIKINDALCSTQLRYISVGLLGELFSPIDPNHAERMFCTAYTISKNAHNHSFAAASAENAASCFHRKQDRDTEIKFIELSQKHWELDTKVLALLPAVFNEVHGGPHAHAY
ncbi:cohesin loading factor-domain-containing protein [Fimicolochytrium jonesii]|uniref:cohesin loading factor-domain-containing protein n=1 Tax=Fimicolochytrium jonesii TaxID=1396493 RepID=UPI0022FEA19B|nr:cohesin loading factor-domain-containing protein [Fimicolochytrium jonesii]KAI8824905.1 cohesin loading factor-domain-containing protein [Fimicolochytrium jonesii]